MRHRKAGIKLNRTSSHRSAMFRNMVTSLFKHERIQTTDTKAKELRSWADHLITLAKRGDLHARRQALSIVREKTVVHKLFEEAEQRFGSRDGGYTRVVKLGRRKGDAAPISLIELVTEAKPVATKKKKKKKKAAGPKVAPEAAKTSASPDDGAPASADAGADTAEATAESDAAAGEAAADTDAPPATTDAMPDGGAEEDTGEAEKKD